jgi:hypothetical protein
MGNGNVLVVRLNTLQPLLALHFLTTEYHPRTVTVPLDSGDFDVVSARDHSRTFRITREGVKGLAGSIDDCRVENIGGTAGEAELEGWTLGAMRVVD